MRRTILIVLPRCRRSSRHRLDGPKRRHRTRPPSASASGPPAPGGRDQHCQQPPVLATQLARARLATATYATNLQRRQSRRLPAHHPHDPRHGLPLPQPHHPRLRRHQAPHPGLPTPRPHLDPRRPGMGLPHHPHHPTATRRHLRHLRRRLPLPTTAASWSPPPRTSAPNAAPRPAPGSASGIRTW